MAEQLWDEDRQGPAPNMCEVCKAGECPHESEFFNVIAWGTEYGMFSCDCLCDEVNFLRAMERPADL